MSMWRRERGGGGDDGEGRETCRLKTQGQSVCRNSRGSGWSASLCQWVLRMLVHGWEYNVGQRRKADVCLTRLKPPTCERNLDLRLSFVLVSLADRRVVSFVGNHGLLCAVPSRFFPLFCCRFVILGCALKISRFGGFSGGGWYENT